MTYQDIVTLIAIKAALAPSSARLVAKRYYHAKVLLKNRSRGYYFTDALYFEEPAIMRALDAARKEVPT